MSPVHIVGDWMCLHLQTPWGRCCCTEEMIWHHISCINHRIGPKKKSDRVKTWKDKTTRQPYRIWERWVHMTCKWISSTHTIKARINLHALFPIDSGVQQMTATLLSHPTINICFILVILINVPHILFAPRGWIWNKLVICVGKLMLVINHVYSELRAINWKKRPPVPRPPVLLRSSAPLKPRPPVSSAHPSTCSCSLLLVRMTHGARLAGELLNTLPM